MKKLLATICAGAVLGLMASCDDAPGKAKAYNQGINIIPTPVSLTQNEGNFKLNKNTKIYASTPEAKTVAEFFAAKMNTATGYQIATADKETSDGISLVIDGSLDVNDEGYTLDVADSGVRIKAKTPQGLFYGMQSFLQLLPAEIESPSAVKGIAWTAPAVSIKDEPRFGYRGIMLDPCRHFIPVENIKKQLDVLALFKINRMHWHLTDDQGWRIEIRHYPELTKVGSRRAETVLGRNTNIYDGIPSGGYYTQRQIRDVVAYAAERFITVIPEIEMPGHASAALAAYPWLGCAGEGYIVRTRWGVFPEVYCAGKDSTFEFMENVLAEVCELFPSEYIHIGGDECPKQSWTSCPACQQRIRNERLEHENELQSYFVHRIEKWLNARGRNLIGWDEILEGGISKTATIMSWRGADGGVAAAKAGNQVIMTPNTHCYLDYFQTQEPERLEPLGIGGYVPVRKVYSFDPYDRLSSAEQSCIQGVQGNIWTEYIASFAHAQHMALPRLAALAEVGWACDRRDFGDFTRRMTVFRKLYDKCGYRYASYFFDGTGE